MNIAMQLEPTADLPPAVQYRWDADTDILVARMDVPGEGTGATGALELAGTDGAWLVLDVVKGRIAGLEIAVWPNVQKRRTLSPPATIEDGHVHVPLRSTQSGPALLEVDTPLHAESDEAERVIYFRVGVRRGVRTVRLGSDLLLDLDPQSRIAGFWLLNVPPFPSS